MCGAHAHVCFGFDVPQFGVCETVQLGFHPSRYLQRIANVGVMRRRSIATAAAIIAFLATASNDSEAANADRWISPVIGDFTAGAILRGVYRPYAYGPLYDPHNYDPAYGPVYYGGTRY
jgi:hypothetical protein